MGSEPSGRADIISHIMASFGNGSQSMACSTIYSPIIRRYLAPMAPFAGSIRLPGTPAQIDVLKSCVFLRKYYQNLTVSLGGYPRGYIAEPGWSPLVSRIYPPIYPPIYPRAYPPGLSPGPVPPQLRSLVRYDSGSAACRNPISASAQSSPYIRMRRAGVGVGVNAGVDPCGSCCIKSARPGHGSDS